MSEHSDDYYLPGSDSYVGICHSCDEPNGDCFDGLCESCLEGLPQMMDDLEDVESGYHSDH